MSDWAIALNRFGLGRKLGERLPDDPRRWLLSQFHSYDARPQRLKRGGLSSEAVHQMNTLRAVRNQAKRNAGLASRMTENDKLAAAATQARIDFRRAARIRYVDNVKASIQTALASDAPFIERLVRFWSNHFAVSVDRNSDLMALAGAFEFEAIRPHLLGKFADMVTAVERHPAMLLFLDQRMSLGPGSAFLSRRPNAARGLNENLAREILELHTMGVRSGYSQADVIELARGLTGWTYSGGSLTAADRFITNAVPGEFTFVKQFHEPGVRKLLDRTYDQAGEAQAGAMLADISRRPETARFISTKLARHFAGDDPAPSLVDRLSDAFLESDGDLPTVYRVLVESPECWAGDVVKFRTPWDWLIASQRALGQYKARGQTLVGLLDQLGQPMWSPGSPAGYEDTAARWLSADTLIRRLGIAAQLVNAQPAKIDPRSLGEALFAGKLEPDTAQRIADAPEKSLGLAILLSSPQMLRR